VADLLRSQRIAAKAYYAGIQPSSNNDDQRLDPDEYRKQLEDLLMENRLKVVVATIALGMGFDKPDIGFVIHFQVGQLFFNQFINHAELPWIVKQ